MRKRVWAAVLTGAMLCSALGGMRVPAESVGEAFTEAVEAANEASDETADAAGPKQLLKA